MSADATFANFEAAADFEASFDAVPSSAVAEGFADFAAFDSAPTTADADFAAFDSAPAAAAEAVVGDDAPEQHPQQQKDAEEEARREHELQRQRRLAMLAEADAQKKAASSSGSWGGWLSSSMPSMSNAATLDASTMLRRISSDAEKAKARLAENVASAAASAASAASALQSPGAGVGSLADLRERAASAASAASEALQKNTEKLQMQSPVASLSKSLGVSKMGAMSTPSMSSLPSFDPKQWAMLGGMSAGGGEEDGAVDVCGADGDGAEKDGNADPGTRKPGEKKSKKQGADDGDGDASPAPPPPPPKPLTEAEKLDAYLAAGQFDKAARYAANSPLQSLRSLETISKFEAAAPAEPEPGVQAPILLYFGALLKRSGPLLHDEGLALARPVVAQGQLHLLQAWMADGKVERSIAVADIIREKDPAAAVAAYRALEGSAPVKVIECYAMLGDIEEVINQCDRLEPPAPPDWAQLLASILSSTGGTPHAIHLEAALRAQPPPPPPPDPEDELAMMAYNMNPPPPPPPSRAACAQIFLEHGALAHATKLALDAATEEPETLDAALQTKVIDANLRADRQVGDALIEAKSFAHYDAGAIAATCEAVGLMDKALRLHAAPDDVARIIANARIPEDEASARVGAMEPADGLQTLNALLRLKTPPANAKALVIARTHWKLLGHDEVVSAFESIGSETGLLCYLSARLAATNDDPSLTLAYLRVCRTAGRVEEVERVTRDRALSYEPTAVLALLKEPIGTAPVDPRPIINVCDRFELAGEMAAIFHSQGKLKHLALYVSKVNPAAAPQIVGGLLDAGADPATVAQMLTPIDASELGKDATLATRLIATCEEREQLGLLKPWLEARADDLEEGSADLAAVREALKQLRPKGFLSSFMG